MEISILIVSKNRKQELNKSLLILQPFLDFTKHEVLVFLDGCSDNSYDLKSEMSWVRWYGAAKSIGASPARAALYKKAKGFYFIGLDDDAHPLYSDFIIQTISVFKKYPNVGVIAFEEIKGIFKSDADALKSVDSQPMVYLTNEFIGCGFAIKKSVYEATNGFPVWMDIYGEESCLSIEVLSKGYDILYTNAIKVNHRVDKEARKLSGNNYYRFERQLRHTTYYYLVYYKNPLFKITKLYLHNFKKYALTDILCFKLFFKVVCEVIINSYNILKYRDPIDAKVLRKMNKIKGIKF
ncbi:glycosyltransferase family 2 protein [Flavisericum labens]|uniref:glycosyltransferase family 2 protein n=1 Tax=Flavisericum labens TaxID=3377112 RepID=UPI00387B8D71